VLHVQGADAGDRKYLVLAKPNVITNDDSEGWRWQEVKPPAERTPTITPRPLGTLDGH
jgi:hypothetical protein